MDVLEKVRKTKRKVKEKIMEKMGVDKICWTTLGFQDPKEFENVEDAEGEAVTRLLVGGDGTQVVIVKITKIDADNKPLKYPIPEIHREYNGGVQWVRDSINPPKEFLT